jgi:putative FmdB family regulatory protein
VPTYQYACTDCGDRSEVVQRFTDDPLTVCSACGGKLRKVFSPVGIVFKGSGFYRTDSRNGSTVGAGKDGVGKDGVGKDGAGKETAASGSNGSSESSSSSNGDGSKSSASSGSDSGTSKSASSGGSEKKGDKKSASVAASS